MSLRFTRPTPWHDRTGKHTTVEIMDGKRTIGKIQGESGSAIPMMQYYVDCEGITSFQTFSLNEAKLKIRDHRAQKPPCGT